MPRTVSCTFACGDAGCEISPTAEIEGENEKACCADGASSTMIPKTFRSSISGLRWCGKLLSYAVPTVLKRRSRWNGHTDQKLEQTRVRNVADMLTEFLRTRVFRQTRRGKGYVGQRLEV